MHLFFLLEPNVLLNHLAVQADRIYAVTLCPEMIASIRFLLQKWKGRKNSYGGTSFQDAHQPGYRQLRRNAHQKMYMVRLNIEFYNLAAQLLTKHHHTFVDLFANRTLQHTEPILRHPHNVVLTMPYDMRCSLEPAHACFPFYALWGQHTERYLHGQVL